MIVSTHPLAADELVDSAEYYARQGSAGLGDQFIAEFEQVVALLGSNPDLGPVWRRPFRRLPLSRFPFSVVYIASGEFLRIVAIAHHSRQPGYWRSRR